MKHTVCYFWFQMTKKYAIFNFALIMSESVAENDFHQKKKIPQGPFLLTKMASTKTNKIKKQTPLFYSNFLGYTTLLLGLKRFFNSKGLKNALCHWLSRQ